MASSRFDVFLREFRYEDKIFNSSLDFSLKGFLRDLTITTEVMSILIPTGTSVIPSVPRVEAFARTANKCPREKVIGWF